MSQPDYSPKTHSLNSGQAASLLFEPGSELFCQQGLLSGHRAAELYRQSLRSGHGAANRAKLALPQSHLGAAEHAGRCGLDSISGSTIQQSRPHPNRAAQRLEEEKA
jgi:hypothetical protein